MPKCCFAAHSLCENAKGSDRGHENNQVVELITVLAISAQGPRKKDSYCISGVRAFFCLSPCVDKQSAEVGEIGLKWTVLAIGEVAPDGG